MYVMKNFAIIFCFWMGKIPFFANQRGKEGCLWMETWI